MRADTENLLDTIGLIYTAATSLSDWGRALDAVSDVCGVANTAFVVNDRDLQIAKVVTPRADPGVIADYESHWWRFDPTIPATADADIGTITSLETTERDRFLASEFHNDFWCRSGLGVDRLATNLLLSENAFASLVLQNGPRQDGVPSDAARIFAMIVPHMIRAVEILRRLEGVGLGRIVAARAATAGAESAVVVDAALRPIANDPGLDHALRTHDCLRLDAGRLRVRDSKSAARLEQLVHDCTARGLAARGGTLDVPDRTRRHAVRLTVIPWRDDADPGGSPLLSQPAALIFIDDSRRLEQHRKAAIQRRFGLTSAETRLAFELLGGGGRAEVAARLNVSVSTVRTHLSSIFDKTGTRRQSELVAMLMKAA